MKTNTRKAIHFAAAMLLLTAAYLLVEQPTQAQITRSGPLPYTQAQKEASRNNYLMAQTAASSLHAGKYAQAEAEARQLMSTSEGYLAGGVLAAALDAQGKDQEALRAYQHVVEHFDSQPNSMLPYALLLLKSGQWKQALAAYNRALPYLPDVGPHPERPIVHDGELMQANSQFAQSTPDPQALAVAIHIARGLIYNSNCNIAYESQNTEAAAEYQKALQLAPNSALTNYYYGQGWQTLSPTERTKFGTAQQAKAALQKAVKLGKGDVKLAAAKALKSFSLRAAIAQRCLVSSETGRFSLSPLGHSSLPSQK